MKTFLLVIFIYVLILIYYDCSLITSPQNFYVHTFSVESTL